MTTTNHTPGGVIMPPPPPLPGTEADTRRRAERTAERMRRLLTPDEQARVLYEPMVVAHLAWLQAEEAADMAAAAGVDGMRKPSRAVRAARAAYDRRLDGELGPASAARLLAARMGSRAFTPATPPELEPMRRAMAEMAGVEGILDPPGTNVRNAARVISNKVRAIDFRADTGGDGGQAF